MTFTYCYDIQRLPGFLESESASIRLGLHLQSMLYSAFRACDDAKRTRDAAQDDAHERKDQQHGTWLVPSTLKHKYCFDTVVRSLFLITFFCMILYLTFQKSLFSSGLVREILVREILVREMIG